MPAPALLILHNIRSAHNVGAMFRTADGAGVVKIYCVGYTPTPKDRFGRQQPEIAKTSLGAHEHIPWEQYDAIETLLSELKAQGVAIVAVEQSSKAISYYEFLPTRPTAYIVGNEVDGVSEDILARADAVVAIPMSGHKESLNVATCAGIILFHHRDGTSTQ